MADIKAAFFTLTVRCCRLRPNLPASTVDALARLRKNGVKTFIATGRPPVHLPYLRAGRHPFDGYVTMNGQYCYLADGELLYTKYIRRHRCKRCCRTLKRAAVRRFCWQRLLPVQPYQRLEP